MLETFLDFKNQIITNSHVENFKNENVLFYEYNHQNIILHKENDICYFYLRNNILDIDIDFHMHKNELVIKQENLIIKRFITKNYVYVDNIKVNIKKYNLSSNYKDENIFYKSGEKYNVKNLLIDNSETQLSITKDENNVVTIYQKNGREIYHFFDNYFLYLNTLYIIPQKINVEDYVSFEKVLDNVLSITIDIQKDNASFSILNIAKSINLIMFILFKKHLLENIYFNIDKVKVDYDVLLKTIVITMDNEDNDIVQTFEYDDLTKMFSSKNQVILFEKNFMSFDDLILYINNII
jgi:hypothetical protein